MDDLSLPVDKLGNRARKIIRFSQPELEPPRSPLEARTPSRPNGPTLYLTVRGGGTFRSGICIRNHHHQVTKPASSQLQCCKRSAVSAMESLNDHVPTVRPIQPQLVLDNCRPDSWPRKTFSSFHYLPCPILVISQQPKPYRRHLRIVNRPVILI